jgi:hypothetical protein
VLHGGEVRVAGVLAGVQRGIGGPLQHGQAAGADSVRGRSADRGRDFHRLAVVEDDRGVQHQHQLCGRLLAAFGGQLQDDGELF